MNRMGTRTGSRKVVSYGAAVGSSCHAPQVELLEDKLREGEMRNSELMALCGALEGKSQEVVALEQQVQSLMEAEKQLQGELMENGAKMTTMEEQVSSLMADAHRLNDQYAAREQELDEGGKAKEELERNMQVECVLFWRVANWT